jgi:hypothetical protein
MTTTSIKELLDSPKLSTYSGKGYNLKAYDVQKDSINTNLQATKYSFTTGIDLLSSTSAKSDNTDKPLNISHQILAEPLAAISGTYPVNSFMGTSQSTTESYLQPASESSQRVASLTKDGKKASDPIKKGTEKAGKTLSSAAESVSRSASKSNGGIIISAGTDLRIGANTLHIGSDAVTNIMSPVFSMNTKLQQIHANQIATISDEQFNIGKNRYTELAVDQKTATYIQTVATESNRSFSKEAQSVATGLNEIQGQNTNIYADDHLEQASASTMRISSRNATSLQSGDLTITASASTEDVASVNAAGSNPLDPLTGSNGYIKLISNGKGGNTGNISVTSSGNFVTNAGEITAAISQSIINVATEAAISATKNSLFSATRTMTISGGQTLTAATNRGGLFIYGGLTFLGRMPIPIVPFDIESVTPGKIVQIPELPTLPSGALSSLEACIPDRFKVKKPSAQDNIKKGIELGKKSAEGMSQDDLPPETNREGHMYKPPIQPNRENHIYAATGTSTSSIGRTSDGNPTLRQPAHINKTSTADKFSPPRALASSNSPNKQETSQVESTSAIRGSEFIKGGLHIYPSRYSRQLPNKQESPKDEKGPDLLPPLLKAVPSAVTEAAKQFKIPDLTTKEVIKNLDKVLIQDVPPYILDMEGGPQLVKRTQDIGSYIAAVGYFGGVIDVLNNNGTEISSAIGIGLPIIVSVSDGLSALEGICQNDLSGLNYFVSKFDSSLTPLINIGDILLKNPEADFRQLVDRGLVDSVSQVLSNFLDDRYASAIPDITRIIIDNTNGQPIDSDRLIDSIASVLQKITGVSEIGTAVGLYRNVQGLIKDINTGDVMTVIKGGSFNSLLDFIAGPENAGTVRDAIDVAETLYGTIEALSKVPELVNLMNKYNIGFLDQVNTILNCLDLLGKINSLLGKVSNLFKGGNPNDAVGATEDLPRLIQAFNTIKDTPENFLDTIDPKVVDSIKQLSLDIPLDGCFRVPTTTYIQGTVEIKETYNARILFGLANPKANILGGKIPSAGDVLQLKINTFVRARDLTELKPYIGPGQYTPTVYSYQITDYQLANNIGIAIISRAVPVIQLQDPQGLIYEYDIDDIGNRLIPLISDAYIVI